MNTRRLTAKRLFKTALLLAVLLTVTSCGPGQTPSPTMTPVPTNTTSPTATSSPTPTQTPTTVPTGTASPTLVPDKIILSDSFENNNSHWELNNSINIEDGLMLVSNGNYQLAAIRIPLESSPSNAMIQVDIIPNAPTAADPSTFVYGAGCRLNQKGDFYFFGVSPATGVDDLFIVTYLQFKETKLVDYQFFPAEFPEAQNGDGITATFRCSDDTLSILAGKTVVAEVINSDFREGELFLGLYQPDGIVGNVKFDNLTVSEVD